LYKDYSDYLSFAPRNNFESNEILEEDYTNEDEERIENVKTIQLLSENKKNLVIITPNKTLKKQFGSSSPRSLEVAIQKCEKKVNSFRIRSTSFKFRSSIKKAICDENTNVPLKNKKNVKKGRDQQTIDNS
jgi:hypothetical protein